ncbi:hypothetical protein JY651_03045 [Pyxidicoccus parkwayensis]|uniref:EF-hand domain-containing protein n=1 Tax=Pyxidicoccus parkwayensis TaxID=2813578 RepID=A0ABX7NZ22_9BACT|nr:hypothetical protein [Pyxidicoccus parkwaysis]QSQ23973.1 hypothetical protein JY651_03045 [Pyxidicoccus parkwaysis]
MTSLLSLCLALTLSATAAEEAPSPPPAVFALVVSNNRSFAPGRAALQYADDDGAKYHEVFSMLAEPGGAVLLTELDSDSRRLFPSLVPVARAPTFENVTEAAHTLAARIAEVKRAGREADFYFVFAGHGDVDKGRGYLELSDRAFDSEDLQALLRQVDATRAHVILDSCNSFFVVSPRKAGGRRYATPTDMTQQLAERLPSVGVLLSTSAEAEVYEWSELQSGVFSHVVRAGLMGAADADGDGRITYAELEAFASIAAQEIPNPLFRPRLFALGPGRSAQATLVDLRAIRSAVTLKVDASPQVRLTLRDARGLRWADVNKEAGVPLALRLPPSVARGMEVERPDAPGAASAWVLEDAAPDTSVELAGFTPAPTPPAARGVQDQLRQLFATPFGPHSMAAFEQARRLEPPPVYGVSLADWERMRQMVETFTAVERDRRRTQNILFGASLATSLGSSVLLLANGGSASRIQGYGTLGLGLFFSGADFAQQLRKEDPEVLLAEFNASEANPAADPGRTIARVDYRLNRFLAQERRIRRQLKTLGLLYLGSGAVTLFLAERQRSRGGDREEVLNGELSALFAAAGGTAYLLRSSYTEGATEHLVRLWNTDADLRRLPRVSVVPARGGAMLALSGSF